MQHAYPAVDRFLKSALIVALSILPGTSDRLESGDIIPPDAHAAIESERAGLDQDPGTGGGPTGHGAAPEAGLAGLREAFERARYEIVPAGAPGVSDPTAERPVYVASNPRQNLTARFDEDRFRIEGTARLARGWSLGMRLRGFGRGDARAPLPAPRLTTQGNRIDYERGSLTEWYVNDARGIEQGFTLAAPPKVRVHDGPLRIELALEGNLEAAMGAADAGIRLTTEAGERVLRYAKLHAVDATGQTLPARMELLAATDRRRTRARTVRLSVDDRGAVYPVTIDPLLFTEAEILPSGAAPGDELGNAVAIDGDTAVIGAHYNDVSGATSVNAGAVFVFVRSAGNWEQQARLTASDAATSDEFGASVSISGDTIVVGAPLNDDFGSDTGSAYVFVRSGGVWSQQQKLTTGASAGDQYGKAVAVDGDTLVIGVPLDDDAGSSSGSAFVFVRSGGVWSQQQKLTALDAAGDDQFGTAVAIATDTVVVGSPQDDDVGSNSGSAYVFLRSGTLWTQQQKLTASDAASGDKFGVSVAISAETAVVGASFGDSAVPDSGAAYVFLRSGSVWSEEQKLTAADAAAGDRFGASIAVDGDTAVVGAEMDSDAGAFSGSAYVFFRSGSTWSQQQKLVAPDAAAGDYFGRAVAVSGDTTVVGAVLDDDFGVDSGSAHVFLRSGALWFQQGKLTEIGDPNTASDWFGLRVALSGDTALITAPGDDDAAARSGSAYVFVRDNGIWSFQAKLTAPDAAYLDQFGQSADIDGDTVIVGTPFHSDTPRGYGAAYVFVRSGTIWTFQQKLTASDAGYEYYFGMSVALDGDTALIGSSGHDGAATDAGAAYAFVRSGSVWSEQQKLLASDAAAGDAFGVSVAVSGDTALVGARDGDGLAVDSGSAYVFVRSGSVWSQQQEIMASDGALDDYFGGFLAINGDTAAVGAPNDDDVASNSGSAYVFTRSGTVWSQQQKLTASDPVMGGAFGTAVSLQGDKLAIGATYAAGVSATTGAAFLFSRSGSTWSQDAKLVASDGATGDRFGSAVSMEGDTTLVGAYVRDVPATDSGTAYVFTDVTGCGDGSIQGSESCDDGGTAPGDGCDAACQIESGWACNGAPSVCQLCGNGLVEGTETCDDGGTAPGDGCDAACQIESGWACNGAPSVCQLCGNGLVEGTETCDDGDTAPGDGCDAACQVESGYSCLGEPSACGPITPIPALSLPALAVFLLLVSAGLLLRRRHRGDPG